jgi:hypothetical protein
MCTGCAADRGCPAARNSLDARIAPVKTSVWLSRNRSAWFTPGAHCCSKIQNKLDILVIGLILMFAKLRAGALYE